MLRLRRSTRSLTASATSRFRILRATRSSTARCATVTAATSKGGMGAAAIQDRLKSFDLEAEPRSSRRSLPLVRVRRRPAPSNMTPRCQCVLSTTNSPNGMVLDCVPVIPPICARWSSLTVDVSRHPTNDLYRRVINRNNRPSDSIDLVCRRSSSTTKSACRKRPSMRCSTTVVGRPVTGPGNRSAQVAVRHAQGQGRVASARTCSVSALTTRVVRSSSLVRSSSCTSVVCRSRWLELFAARDEAPGLTSTTHRTSRAPSAWWSVRAPSWDVRRGHR